MEVIDHFNQILYETLEIFFVVAIATQPELRYGSKMLEFFEEFEKWIKGGGFLGGHYDRVQDQFNILFLAEGLYHNAVVNLF